MAKLGDLGFKKDAIVETIVSTYNADGEPNAAPMGAKLIDMRHLVFNLYNSSKTLSNIKSSRCAVVNLTGDIEVYYRSAFKEANPSGVLPKEWFLKAEAVNAPKLRMAEATVEVSVADLAAQGTQKTRVLFTVEQVNATQKFPQVYCRAFGATLEAIIHATRIKALANDPAEREHIAELLERVAYNNDVVNHVAPDSSYSVVLADLMERIGVWVQK
ncbi:MAG: DUF447 domain-containing protein [Candidatus Bathyarchaeia archaeon]|jgi:hypothetical protein